MNAADRIQYASILVKINKGRISELTEDDYLWLKKHPTIIPEIRWERKKSEAMEINKDCKGTINEILHNLGLSDRMMR
jgi:hypothetical protein